MAAIWGLIGNKSIVIRIRDTYDFFYIYNYQYVLLYCL